MEKIITVKTGDYVQFPYHDNPSLKLTGYVVNVLTNTIVVDVSEILQIQENELIEIRQVVKHGCYERISKHGEKSIS
ncbi:DUF2187 domain-containing protein [Bacillus cereus]|uniref:DUF2187 domain-containing protein n=1 Tax=Bacillus cereus VD048 TaxID=1053226 RepID=J8HP98_BACCE|nr:DUF2187 domain-containing protein [Bacillus cereus]EJR27765.1 hypothetical protein IIG_04792 [Bacillus cereus VD048]